MEQHPIPQQISSYEFRLVGDMTLKQFGQVAGGVIIGLIIHATHLPTFIKWPLVILPVGLGVAMAFFPIEERPIQTWIVSFLKAIYSPTQYIWQKKARIPEILAQEKQKIPAESLRPRLAPQDKQKLTSYLYSLPKIKSEVEVEEERFLDKIQNLFSSLSLSPNLTGPEELKKPLAEKPKEKEEPAGVKVRRLQGPLVVEVEGQGPIREIKMEKEEIFPKVIPSYAPVQMPMPKRERGPVDAIKEAEFGEIPMPGTPTIPNIIVGMITDKEGKIIEGAIIEIRDGQGNPVRAFKTNMLGQFQVVTPLPNGTYEIEVEKEGYNFDLYKFGLSGEIMQPIKIRAK